jgi:tetratricopeptide (TPR) repeat protein
MRLIKSSVATLALTLALLCPLALHAADPVYLKEARAAWKAKNYQKTIDLLSIRLDVAPREAFLLLAKAYQANGNDVMALNTLTTGQARFSKDNEMATELGRAQFAANKEKDAKQTLKTVIENSPTFESAYLAMAEVYEKKNNRYELRLVYQDLVDKIGPKPKYLTALCGLFTRDGIYDQAFNYCTAAIKKTPAEPKNYINLASANKETGKDDEAALNYKKAADSFSKSEEAQFAYAQFLDDKKKFVESYPYYRRAVKADPKSLRSWQALAFTSLEIQKFGDSINAFDTLCRLDHHDGPRQARRATSMVVKMGQETWEKKFRALIARCEALTPKML